MNAKPLDELLFDLALELEATGFVDGPIVATIELPSKVFQRVLGHLAFDRLSKRTDGDVRELIKALVKRSLQDGSKD